MTSEAAPNPVLSLISCKCTQRCHYSDCSCMFNGLKCTIPANSKIVATWHRNLLDIQDSSDSDSDSDD